MPSLPTLHIHSPEHHTHTDWKGWGLEVVQVLTNSWSGLIYVVNALCRVDALANRAATPDIDEILFVAQDTRQLYVAVNGLWENVGPRRGQATIANPATTAVVTLSTAEPDVNYHVLLTPSYDTTVWWSGKQTGQFTVNVATAPAALGFVDWVLWRAGLGPLAPSAFDGVTVTDAPTVSVA